MDFKSNIFCNLSRFQKNRDFFHFELFQRFDISCRIMSILLCICAFTADFKKIIGFGTMHIFRLVISEFLQVTLKCPKTQTRSSDFGVAFGGRSRF